MPQNFQRILRINLLNLTDSLQLQNFASNNTSAHCRFKSCSIVQNILLLLKSQMNPPKNFVDDDMATL